MRKLIAAINMTLNGNCDHREGIPDEELHQHYTNLLNKSGAILYGRTTYQLMEYWRTVLKNPTGEKLMDDFAIAIDKIPKIVFSHTLKNVDWQSARLAKGNLKEEVLELKQSQYLSKDICVGSPGLIRQLMNSNLIDEFQLCIHPVIAVNGNPLFKNMDKKNNLKLVKTKSFSSGAIVLYYEFK